MTVQGYVTNMSKKGCFVALNRELTGHVKMSELGDGFVADPEKKFTLGTLVTGKIIRIDTTVPGAFTPTHSSPPPSPQQHTPNSITSSHKRNLESTCLCESQC